MRDLPVACVPIPDVDREIQMRSCIVRATMSGSAHRKRDTPLASRTVNTVSTSVS